MEATPPKPPVASMVTPAPPLGTARVAAGSVFPTIDRWRLTPSCEIRGRLITRAAGLRPQAMRTLHEMVNSSDELKVKLAAEQPLLLKTIVGLLLLDEHLGSQVATPRRNRMTTSTHDPRGVATP